MERGERFGSFFGLCREGDGAVAAEFLNQQLGLPTGKAAWESLTAGRKYIAVLTNG